MNKNYIKVEPLQDMPRKKPSKEQQDKIARLYALAEKMRVKIGHDEQPKDNRILKK